MNNILKSFKKNNEFLKNILTLLSGSTIAQIITLITIPFLTRIYTPEDFGFIAIYLSLANVIATISTGRYELAIILPKQKEDALSIIKGTFWIVIFISLISFVIILILKSYDNIFTKFINPAYFYFFPLSVLILGLIKIFSQWYTRQKEFKFLASATIFQSGSTSVSNIGFGFLYYIQSTGLFIGHILGQCFQLILFSLKFFKKEKYELRGIDKNDIKTQLKENINFPYFSAPMGFLNSISVDILIYILNLFYSTTLVGLYTNATKVINYPLNFITQSFTSVFYQKISETEKKVKFFMISYFSNLIIAVIAMIPIIFWGEELFSFVLGKEWEAAGSIAKYLAPLTIASFAMRSVSNIFSLTRKNGILLIWQIIYLILILTVIFFTKSSKFEIMIIGVSILGALLYFVLAFIGYRIMINKYEKNI
ncbi:MAG: hypothetical protein A2X13_05065 [Bacteroidetes bacterium GWC2_33_15]|nr:MAG: hypothetical protein A2X10_12935 [Bacteroidetes bacterium GWA2_33_15]OFX50962.1 MAG: hypothetical protein A2X13_05065 [Bacteroidetes bacterium GWC2_33_15]OFX66532.1 MAG: hypothetical protein A2X15_15295 [Bacteroidetes bacterium GWB2_32_14]OFX70188.1 MAG: hypothetical protein A2X14_12825 [Bacteroidetes bacterium GWD2_33_33]HAN19998.1 hypothetical protein [Bacteroidales bacterium]